MSRRDAAAARTATARRGDQAPRRAAPDRTTTATPVTGAAVGPETVSTVRVVGGRLAGVDGLRAIAATWVVLFHMRAFSGATLKGIPGADLVVRSGSTGVSLFLVLSGFCLYIPFAGGRTERFHATTFFRRRFLRLYPAYATTLVITVVALVVAGGSIGLTSFSLADAAGQGLAHLTMVHTLLPSTFYAVNGAYWSLGLEWQLYLTLPLLILAVRRVGLVPTLVGVLVVNIAYRLVVDGVINHGGASGITATAVLPNLFPGRWAEFGLGMLAAELHARGRIGAWTVPLGAVALLLVPVAVHVEGSALEHILFGAVFFVLLLVVLDRENPVARIAAWRPLAALGSMSYSLYLVHQPIVQAAGTLMRRHGVSSIRTFEILVAGLPVLVGIAVVLFLTVERRTLTARRPVAAGSLPRRPATGTLPRAESGAVSAGPGAAAPRGEQPAG